MVSIGIDPHKTSHTAVAVDQREQPVGQRTVLAGPQATAGLLAWAGRWPERRWAVESARGLGYHLAQQLVTAGEQVIDVHAKLATRVRLLDRGHGRKTDQADARSVALVALRTPTLALVGAEDDLPAVVRLLADRRDELNQERRRVTNRLHRLLRRTRPTTAADQQRKALAHELLADLRRLDRQLAANRTRCQDLLAVRPSRLLDVFGISTVLAVKLIGHSGDITRFHSPDHYASYTGTAPVEASSGDVRRHRLNRGGNRQLNTALHLIAVCQIRDPSPGQTYYRRKLDQAKTPEEARRSLKRHLANVVYSHLATDQHHRTQAC